MPLDPEIHYRLLKILENDSTLSQRRMAEAMGVSLGKLNYCLSELTKKGFVKINRFKNSDNKAAYIYNLTPSGIEEKARVTVRFLRSKMREYEEIKRQIEEISSDLQQEGAAESLKDPYCKRK